MTPPRVPEPKAGGLRLTFAAAFRFDRLRWRMLGGLPQACSYCGGQLAEDCVPNVLIRDDGAAAALCDDCASDALQVVAR